MLKDTEMTQFFKRLNSELLKKHLLSEDSHIHNLICIKILKGFKIHSRRVRTCKEPRVLSCLIL